MVSNNYSDLLVSALREFVKHGCEKRKRRQEKEALPALVTACTTYLPAHVSHHKIHDLLGFQTRSSSTHMKREIHSFIFKHIVHKDRLLSYLQKHQRYCVDKFCHSDKASSIASNSCRIVNIVVDGGIYNHFRKVWNTPTVQKQHKFVVQSDTFEEYNVSKYILFKYVCSIHEFIG